MITNGLVSVTVTDEIFELLCKASKFDETLAATSLTEIAETLELLATPAAADAVTPVTLTTPGLVIFAKTFASLVNCAELTLTKLLSLTVIEPNFALDCNVSMAEATFAAVSVTDRVTTCEF